MVTTQRPGTQTIDQLTEEWRKRDIRHVLFELPDMHGMPRSKIVPLSQWKHFAQHGLNMIGVMVTVDTATLLVPETYHSEERNYGDSVLRADLSTASIVPWMEHTARVICDPYWPDGTPLDSAPRYILRKMLDRLAGLGYFTKSALEFEFYLLQNAASREPVFDRLHIFHTPRNFTGPVPAAIMEQLPEMGIEVLTCNCEYGPGQFEITYDAQRGLSAGDQGYTFKQAVKGIARQQGYHATFMTKPFAEESASGSHVHISLQDKDGRNVLLDRDDARGNQLSDAAYHFVAGILKHAPAALALMAPTPNCYRRYVEHAFAPVNVSWGLDDRTALVRVKNTGDEGTHIENRLPSGMSNPYLTLAATVASGILGLQERELPHELFEGSAGEHHAFPPLPANLDEALTALEQDEALRQLLGTQFTEIFIKVKRQEMGRRSEYVQPHIAAAEQAWEDKEYLADY